MTRRHTSRRALNITAVAGIVAVVAGLAWSAINTPDQPPDVLVFPPQNVLDQTREDEGHPTIARDSERLQVEALLCNTGEVDIATEVTLEFGRPGGPQIPLTSRPLVQLREPGCEARLSDCPDDLEAIDAPAPVTECLPPIPNLVPRTLLDEFGSPFPWRITVTAVAVNGDAQDVTAETNSFGVRLAAPFEADP